MEFLKLLIIHVLKYRFCPTSAYLYTELQLWAGVYIDLVLTLRKVTVTVQVTRCVFKAQFIHM